MITRFLPTAMVAGAATVTLLVAGASDVAAQRRPAAALPQIKVDWSDPEIERFRERQRGQGANVNALFDPRLAKLKLPVLGFEKPMPKIERSFGLAPPPARRSLTMDEANPVWYVIEYDYGDDIKITVEADLRIQNRVPPGQTLDPGPRNFAADDEISVFDSNSEIGMIGAIAEFKVYKFDGVPYTVTIECSDAKKSTCQDVDALKADRKFLEIILARPD